MGSACAENKTEQDGFFAGISEKQEYLAAAKAYLQQNWLENAAWRCENGSTLLTGLVRLLRYEIKG
jgi:hypothetical protein